MGIGEERADWVLKQRVRSYEVDFKGVVTIPVLCQWMQEAAYEHAEALGLGYQKLAAMQQAWVLSRQRIEFGEWPQWGERVLMRTWPSGADRLFFYRDFECLNAEGQRVLAASTAWFVMDLNKRARVGSTFWQEAEHPTLPSIFPERPRRLKGAAVGARTENIRVHAGDLDMSAHVNNVRYLSWMLERQSLDVLKTQQLRSVEMNFLQEAICGDAVALVQASIGQGAMRHGLFRADQELWRAETKWADRSWGTKKAPANAGA